MSCFAALPGVMAGGDEVVGGADFGLEGAKRNDGESGGLQQA